MTCSSGSRGRAEVHRRRRLRRWLSRTRRTERETHAGGLRRGSTFPRGTPTLPCCRRRDGTSLPARMQGAQGHVRYAAFRRRRPGRRRQPNQPESSRARPASPALAPKGRRTTHPRRSVAARGAWGALRWPPMAGPRLSSRISARRRARTTISPSSMRSSSRRADRRASDPGATVRGPREGSQLTVCRPCRCQRVAGLLPSPPAP